MSKSKTFYRIWWVCLFFKLTLSYYLPLASDEAYYWVWSHHLQWSYFDHPPFIAWLFKLGHLLEPYGHAVRWPIVLFGHTLPLIWFSILKEYLTEERMNWWLILLCFSPMVGFGSIITTPDIPLLVFWSLSLLFFMKLLNHSSYVWTFLLGSSLGLGFCSKYHIVIFVLISLFYLTFEKKWPQIGLKKFLATFLIALLFSSPVLFWNYQNDFVSFRFQIDHGLGATSFNWSWPMIYVLGQILLLFPPLLFYYLKRSPVEPLSTHRLFQYFTLGPLLFFLLTSFKGHVEANWPIMSYPAFFAVCSRKLKSSFWIKMNAFFWSSILALLLFQIYKPWISLPPHSLKTNEPWKYKSLIEKTEAYQPLFASNFQMASYIYYRTKNPIFKLQGMGRKDFYDFIPLSRPNSSQFYVAVEADITFPEWLNSQEYTVKEIAQLPPNFFIFEVSRK